MTARASVPFSHRAEREGATFVQLGEFNGRHVQLVPTQADGHYNVYVDGEDAIASGVPLGVTVPCDSAIAREHVRAIVEVYERGLERGRMQGAAAKAAEIRHALMWPQ